MLIFVTVFGIIALVRLVHPLKTPSPRFVVPFLNVQFVMLVLVALYAISFM